MSVNKMTKDETVALQSRAEAHLYIAVAKADGIISRKEHATIGLYAAKAQKLYDVLDINSDIAKQVRKVIKKILADARFNSWSTDDHVNEAVSLLKEARDRGNWSVSLASLKHERGLLQVALLDEYVFVESAVIKKIHRRLERELGGAKNKKRP
ncbi:MAG: hypothetical protein JW913_03105 [Chitinispirillaceae bacterium]|nr:hypothetical protein [Chitinispirillaceae bacterium]